MTYTIGIPTSTQSLGETQNAVKTNFEVANTVMGNDHFKYTETNPGKHRLIRFPVSSMADPGTATGELALYDKAIVAGGGGGHGLYVRQEGSGNIVQLTRNIPVVTISSIVPALTPGGGSQINTSFLPQGLVKLIGRLNKCASDVKYRVTFAGFTISSTECIQLTVENFFGQVGGYTINCLRLDVNSFDFIISSGLFRTDLNMFFDITCFGA